MIHNISIRLLQVLSFLTGLMLLVVGIILGVDTYQTQYLTIDSNERSQNSYLIKNVNVIPMTQDTVFRQTQVLILNGKIKEIGNQITANDIPVVDAKNQYLTPGLIDMHVHIWDRYELGLNLAHGVTAVRNVWGMPMHLDIKKEIAQQNIYAPMFFTTGPKLTGPEFIGDDNLQLFSPEEAKAKILSYKERGYDFIKTYYGLTQELYDAVLEQAKDSDMDIVAHASQHVPYTYHFNPQIKSIEHAEDIVQLALNYQLDTLKLRDVVNDFKNAETVSFCPTLTVFYNISAMLKNDAILDTEALLYMNALIKKIDSKAQFDRWHSTKQQDPTVVSRIDAQHAFHLYSIQELHKAGIPIVCGTDAGIGVTVPGSSIHQELAFYLEAGFSEYEALATATVNAAKVHQHMNSMGTIAKGKQANLLLVKDNPLENLSTLEKPQLVFIQGRKLDNNKLQQFKDKAYQRTNLLATAFRYAENLWVEK